MKSPDANTDDDLLPEYNLRSLRVRKFGPARKSFGEHGVVLDADVASAFPDSNSVNEALRFLLRVARNPEVPPTPSPTAKP
jgi:hypothetical protein